MSDHFDQAFKKMLEGVRMADEARDEIMRGLDNAWTAGLDIKTQLTDLRETVDVLRGMILEQGKELRDLRERLNSGDHP